MFSDSIKQKAYMITIKQQL